ncbi:NAD(+)/NADH kinase [Salinibacterium sp. NYA9b]
MALAPRVVLVHRRTEYTELLQRHSTAGQAEFFLKSRGRSIEEVRERHEVLASALTSVSTALPAELRQARVERADLDRYPFSPEDIVVIIGQDGLVANVAKYLTGQPVIGIDPEPARNSGALVRFAPSDAVELVQATIHRRLQFSQRTMVEGILDDGQRLVALNELYFGNRGHQSARYAITLPNGAREEQSSSGIIIATGTGSTGWSTSIASDRFLTAELPPAGSDHLRWYIREAWPSPSTGRSLTDGTLTSTERLEVVVQSDTLVLFGDGIEADHLSVGWGQKLTIGTSSRTLTLA